MLTFKRLGDTELRTLVRGVSRFGTFCCVSAMVVFISGCPGVVPLCAGVSCDDDNACTTDTCVDDVCVNTNNTDSCDDSDACTTDDACAGGVCAGTALTCDDGDLCTDDSCDAATGACVNEAVVCADTEVCVDGACVLTCTDDAGCDDADLCTTDSCVDGACSNVQADCDDGNLCTDDSCDSTTGTCANDAVTCAAGETCDSTDGTCVPSCTTNSECDDGAFCNGAETCDILTGICSAGTDACAADETCDETADTCTFTGTGLFFTLTLAQDSGAAFAGGSGDDTYTAPLIFNPGTGTNLPSLQVQDVIDAGGGTDTMTATFQAAANTVTPTMTNLEIFNLTDFGTGTTTFSATNSPNLTSLTSVDSTQDVIVTNLAALVDLGITNSTQNLTVTFLTAATSATNDASKLTLSNATGGTTTTQNVTINTGTSNGIETLTIDSVGSANSINQLLQGTGTTMARVNVTGNQSLAISVAMDNSITTYDCSNSSGGCSLSLGNGVNTFTGGPASDTCIFSLANFTSTDTVNGGDGTDTLSLLSADADNATIALTNVSNIEGLTVSDAMAAAVNATFYGSIANVNLNAGTTGATLTIATGTTVTFGVTGASNDSTGANVLTVSGLSTNDTATVTYADSDSTGSTTFTGIEVVNLNSNVNINGAAADGGANTFTGVFALPDVAGASLTINGTEDVAFTAAVTARTINAASFGHKLLMTLNTTGATTTSTVATGGGTINSGTGDDILVGSTAGDTISGGGGADVIQPGRGIDTANFSGGSNILDLEDLAVAQALAVNRCTATGFTANGTAYTTTNEVDAIRFDNLGTLGDLSDGAVTAEFQVVTTPANVTATAGVSIVELAFEASSSIDLDNDLTGALLLSACGATSGTTACTLTTQAVDEDIVIIAYQSSNAYIYHGNGVGTNTALIGSEIALIAVVTGNVTVGGFDFSQFIN